MINWTPEELAEMAVADAEIDADESIPEDIQKVIYTPDQIRSRKYYADHRQHEIERTKRWRKNNKEKYKQIQHNWYLRNKARIVSERRAKQKAARDCNHKAAQTKIA